ncbi:hypothetical protein AAHE18_07G029600 [Arachis hypogaea]
MANSMVYISFLLSSVFLLSSHVLTHEQFKENTTMNVDWYNPSAGKKSHVFRKRKDPFQLRRPWVEHSEPWPGGHASKKPALQPRLKKNKINAAPPQRPPPPTN